ncbi:MAG: transposase [Moraxellaceae bacterium]|jgi:transposase|nr:transposase [Moraxellaceae bacterium]MBL0231004.1 transposase [Moraxellaceae bacterium]
MKATKSTKKPTYSLEFKQDAAKLVLEKGYSCQKAADHLGVSLSALSRWVKAERPPNVSEALSKKSGLSLSEHDELRRLRKENEQLRMEREILKKAAVFFAKEVE